MSPRDVRPPRRSVRIVALAAALVTLCIAASCGVGIDETPRALQAPETTTTIASTPTAGRFESVLYFVREGTLLPVIEELSDRGLQSILTALVQVPDSSSTVSGLGTSIPSGTEVLSLERTRGVLTIDLSAAFDNVVGLSRQQAIGQMVLTATQVADLDAVVFEVEGEQITVSSPARGDRTDVDACDFASLLAALDDVGTAGLPFESLEVLAARRAALDEQCT